MNDIFGSKTEQPNKILRTETGVSYAKNKSNLRKNLRNNDKNRSKERVFDYKSIINFNEYKDKINARDVNKKNKDINQNNTTSTLKRGENIPKKQKRSFTKPRLIAYLEESNKKAIQKH